MSDDVKHPSDELAIDSQDTMKDDVSTDSASTTGSQTDESGTSLDLEGDFQQGKDARRAQEKANMVKSYVKRIKDGDMSLADLPKESKWLSSDIEKELGIGETKAPAPKEDTRELVQFELRQEQLRQADLKAEDRKLLKEKYKVYRAKGFSQREALEEAIAFSKIDLSSSRPTPPTIKTGSGVQGKKTVADYTAQEVNNMSAQERGKLILESRRPR